MPKQFFKKLLPEAKKITEHKILKLFGPIILEPRLWHLQRRTVSKACAIGVFCAFLPVPIQMLLAAFFAIYWRANLPLSMALVWISNPITIPPMFYFNYKVGTWILGVPVHHVSFEFTWHWLMTEVAAIWKPLFLGSFICGFIAATIAYFLVRFVWWLWIVNHINNRRKKNGKAKL